MRIPGDWMRTPDPYILEYLSEEGLSTPSDIAGDDRLQFTRSYVNKRLQSLEDHGMTQNVGNGVYRITEQGEDWLSGDFDGRDAVSA